MDRAQVIGQLQRELAAARDAHESSYAAQLERRIAALSQGSAANPATETTAAVRRPARSKG